jgi:glycolate oxidase FAD binding subunit
MRDYVIGISAVDGRGTLFKGGGRVVKNVAGYDFCKLLTGSLGTLGIITQLTLKVRPIPERSVLISAGLDDLAHAETLLAGLVTSGTTPAAIELVAGPAWTEAGAVKAGRAATILVGMEGTSDEVAWMIDQLQSEWAGSSARDPLVYEGGEATTQWQQLTEFPVEGNSPLVLHCSVRPSRIVQFCSLVRGLDLPCSIQAHAGTGVAILRFEEFSSGDISPVLIHQLQPAVAKFDGRMKVLRADASLGELPRQVVWGTRDGSVDVMVAVQQQFDPAGILNPGRFVY